MTGRYLFGPVSNVFARELLPGPVSRGDCLPFDQSGDFAVRWDDSWESIVARFPSGWQPDWLVLFLPYRVIPKGLWDAPIPIIGLAGDWNLLCHHYRNVLSRCDLVFTDVVGVETLTKAGFHHVRVGHLFGCQNHFLQDVFGDEPRSIDVLFVGNFHPAVQNDRLSWLARVAQLSDRWNIHLATGVFGEEYRRLLRKSRIVFNRSIRQECNSRVVEAIAEGALLFQEADNREASAHFKDRQECIFYTDENLETLLEYYLEHEEERLAIAQAAHKRLPELSFGRQWDEMTQLIRAEEPELQDKVHHRANESRPITLKERTWQVISCTFGNDAALADDLATALQESPCDAVLHNLRGIAFQVQNPSDLETVANAFQKGWTTDPSHLMTGLNLAEILVVLGQKPHAFEQAQRTLAILDRLAQLPEQVRDAPHSPPGYNWFRVAWEKAAWSNAGNSARENTDKRQILRWRLLEIMGDSAGELVHYFQSYAACPELACSQKSLGAALTRADRPAEALPYLRSAYRHNPFDRECARCLFLVLGQLNLMGDQKDLIRERRRLAKAASQLVPEEPWFAPLPPLAVASKPARALRIHWQGPQEGAPSMALLNREICFRLRAQGHQLFLDSREQGCVTRQSGLADVHISHEWPPNFEKPSERRWVMILDWEFGNLPSSWSTPLTCSRPKPEASAR